MPKCSQILKRQGAAAACSRNAVQGCDGMCRQHHACTARKGDCSVCLAPLAGAANAAVVLQCRHAFHASCLQGWIVQAARESRSAATCPLCRVQLGPDDYSAVYSKKLLDTLYLVFLMDLPAQQHAIQAIEDYAYAMFEEHVVTVPVATAAAAVNAVQYAAAQDQQDEEDDMEDDMQDDMEDQGPVHHHVHHAFPAIHAYV